MTNDLKSALTIVYGDIVAVNEKADTNATNIESNTSNIETLQQEVANLKASASGVLYNETEVSGVGYELSVSENALPYGTMDIVGGMSYEATNLASNGVNYNSNWEYLITFYAKPNTTYYVKSFNETASVVDSGVYLIYSDSTTNVETYYTSAYTHNIANGFSFTTGDIEEGTYRLRYVKNTNTALTGNIMLVEGTTAPTEYEEYFEGIRNTIITSIISKDSDDNTLATGEIPDEVQALEGYGEGNPDDTTEYNYIDFTNLKYVQVGYIDTDSESWVSLDTPIETDISEYITDNTLLVGASGTITLENDYEQEVPYQYTILEKVSE